MKFIFSTIAALVFSTPVLAQHPHQPYTRHNHQHHHYHHRNNWVGPAIIGAIGTAIIIDQYGRQRPVIVDNMPPVVVSPVPPVVVQVPHVSSPSVICSEWREYVDQEGRYFKERICRSN